MCSLFLLALAAINNISKLHALLSEILDELIVFCRDSHTLFPNHNSLSFLSKNEQPIYKRDLILIHWLLNEIEVLILFAQWLI